MKLPLSEAEMIDRHRHFTQRFAAERVALSTIGTFLVFFGLVSPAHSQLIGCNPDRYGQGGIICGINGGTSSQVFSPGSVIILREDPLFLPGERPETPLPEVQRRASTPTALSFLAGGDATMPGRSMWVFGDILTAFEERSATSREPASESDFYGGVVGVRGEHGGLSASFSLDYLKENADVSDSNRTGLQDSDVIPFPAAGVDRQNLGLAGSARLQLNQNWAAFAGARIGYIDVKTARTVYSLFSVDVPDPDAEPEDNISAVYRGKGSTSGWAFGAGAGVSYASALGSGLYGGASGSMTLQYQSVGGFTERTSDGIRTFAFEDDSQTSILSRVAIEVARPIVNSDLILVPALRVAWLHEFADSSRIISVQPYDVDDPSNDPLLNPFDFRTNDPDRDFFTIGGSLAVALRDSPATLSADYRTLVGHDRLDGHYFRLSLAYPS